MDTNVGKNGATGRNTPSWKPRMDAMVGGNGADGRSRVNDIEGKGARVAPSESGDE